MAEERINASTFEDTFFNKLKAVDAYTLEQTIAKAVGDLVGVELRCSISQLKYDKGYSITRAAFDVSLHEPYENMFGQTKTSAEEL